jgi:beta-galactosidase
MGAALERLVDFDNGMTFKTYFTELNMKPSEANTHFVVNAAWRIYVDGTMTMQSAILPRGRVIELPRLGYSLELIGDLDQVKYRGRGPFENYPDRKAGAFIATYTDSVSNMVVNYARPNDMGNRENATAVELYGDKTKATLLVTALNDGDFAFSALPYTATDLCHARHPQELATPGEKTILTLLCTNRGLGGASCGPGPLDRDIPRANVPYRLNLAFRPKDSTPFMSSVRENEVALDETMPPPPETFVAVECSSQEPGSEGGKACDGDPMTIWHTQYGVTLGKYPHSVALDLNKTRTLKGITVMGRQDGVNGRVKDYKVEVSADRKTWKQVAAGALRDTGDVQEIRFASAEANVRYVRFTGLSEQRGQEFASMAEIGIIE